MKEYIFKLTDKVRDYECDLQGVVNTPWDSRYDKLAVQIGRAHV